MYKSSRTLIVRLSTWVTRRVANSVLHVGCLDEARGIKHDAKRRLSRHTKHLSSGNTFQLSHLSFLEHIFTFYHGYILVFYDIAPPIPISSVDPFDSLPVDTEAVSSTPTGPEKHCIIA